jgi:hypothetical protein
MDLAGALHLLGAGITLALGALGAFAPDAAARLTSIAPVGLPGRSELRATYGGFFLALGAFALFTRDEVAFDMLGAAWFGAAALRLAATAADGPSAKAFAAAVFEAGIAILLLFPGLPRP